MREPQGPFQGQETNPLPPQVLNLARCERELALIIYLEGAMTAKSIEARLPRKLSNSALRAMLQRLCRKGILRRQKINGSHNSTDRRIPYLYTPAITVELVRSACLAASRAGLFRRFASERRGSGGEGPPGERIESDDHAVGRRIRDEHRRLKHWTSAGVGSSLTFQQRQKQTGGISPARQVVRQASILEDLRLRIDEERPAAGVEAGL